MKKRFKGFTLIECLVALAVLGIASLTMAQIYASVAQRNRNNHIVNTSISNQMSYVERYTDSQTVPIYYGSTSNTADSEVASSTKRPPHKMTTITTNYNYVKITKVKATADPLSDTFNTTSDRIADSSYSFPVDVYVLMSRDKNDVNSSSTAFDAQYKDYFKNSSGNDKDLNLRYKYITGHTTT
ncbi:MAG: prepilin-type N-terminal cleavage/methylation domain-containing protein [Ruminococcus sp.]|nr:prepilin-type N-terminal cleavage/methylation domain-containing protein [Ruminococcus sp.]